MTNNDKQEILQAIQNNTRLIGALEAKFDAKIDSTTETLARLIGTLNSKIDNLASATKRGFDEVHKRLDDASDERFELGERIGVVESEVSQLRDNVRFGSKRMISG